MSNNQPVLDFLRADWEAKRVLFAGIASSDLPLLTTDQLQTITQTPLNFENQPQFQAPVMPKEV